MNDTNDYTFEDEYNEEVDTNKLYMGIVYKYNNLINGNITPNEFQNIDDFNKVINSHICAYRITKKEFMEYDFDLIENYPDYVINPYIEIIKIEHIKFQNENEENYYSIAILKTHYLRIIQKKWKRLYKEKIQRMSNPINIHHRMITGKWPNSCRYCLLY